MNLIFFSPHSVLTMVKTVRVSKMTEEARNVFRCMCTHARVCMSDEFDVDGD